METESTGNSEQNELLSMKTLSKVTSSQLHKCSLSSCPVSLHLTLCPHLLSLTNPVAPNHQLLCSRSSFLCIRHLISFQKLFLLKSINGFFFFKKIFQDLSWSHSKHLCLTVNSGSQRWPSRATVGSAAPPSKARLSWTRSGLLQFPVCAGVLVSVQFGLAHLLHPSLLFVTSIPTSVSEPITHHLEMCFSCAATPPS